MKKAIFLDRDGTINIDKDYLFKVEDYEYIEGAVEGLRALTQMGYLLIIITNQSGIARGYYTEEDYLRLESWMLDDLKDKGIDISGVYYCPHHPEASIIQYKKECKCRKPGTELFWKAQRDFDIDMNHSFAIGDRSRDLCICKESGVKGILLNKDLKRDGYVGTDKIYTCANWKDIVKLIGDYG